MAQAPNKRPRLDSGEAEDPPLAFFALGEQGEDYTLSEEEDEVEDVVDVGDAAAQTVAAAGVADEDEIPEESDEDERLSDEEASTNSSSNATAIGSATVAATTASVQALRQATGE